MATSFTSTQISSSNLDHYIQKLLNQKLIFYKQVCVGFYGLPGREEYIQESENIFPNGGSHSRGCRPGVLQVRT